VKLPKQTAGKLAMDNMKSIDAWGKTELKATPYYALLLLLADMFDTIAKGDNCYAVIGATSNRTAYSLTVNISHDKASIYAASFDEIAAGAADWL